MAVNKVVLGNETLIDLTGDTVTANALLSGVTAHSASGTQITGSYIAPLYLKRIYISTPPTKTSYTIGETLDLTGMVVKAVWSDDSETVITNSLTTNPANGDTLSASDTSVDVTYEWSGAESIYATSQSITVVPAPSVYGAVWDGESDTTWTRTDDAASFSNPQPYYAGMSGTPSSPFDNIQPWAGMVKVTNAKVGVVVAIPKFYYKMGFASGTKGLKIQIAPATNGIAWALANGFKTSPAHVDRGDGKGERDIVYVGRYHCSIDYTSISGVKPKVSIKRSTARTEIHTFGDTFWQNDYAMRVTLWMLYLVEFANWNSQAKIGGGCSATTSASSAVFNMGYTDSMPYHTGTVSGSIGSTVYGGTQYRNIEGLWDNCYDWCDGIYFSGANVYGILNPANFSDTENGVLIGTRPTSSNYISAWSISSATNYEWMIYPSAVDGSESTYVGDRCNYGPTGIVLRVGGFYNQHQGSGLFNLTAEDATSNSYTGSRLMILP